MRYNVIQNVNDSLRCLREVTLVFYVDKRNLEQINRVTVLKTTSLFIP